MSDCIAEEICKIYERENQDNSHSVEGLMRLFSENLSIINTILLANPKMKICQNQVLKWVKKLVNDQLRTDG